MKKAFADSNIFLRYLLKDDENQFTEAQSWIERAKRGELALVVGPPVFFEIAWTLKRFKFKKEDIAGVLDSLLATPNLIVTDRSLAEEAVRMARQTGVEFADCYIAASARRAGADCLATFNRRHFSALPVKLDLDGSE
jgi:predicted nucleic acid-binding protein